MSTLINILTRTSRRPKFFEVCKNSIENQTYKNIRHIICIDNDESEEYVKGLDFIRVHKKTLPNNATIDGHKEIVKPYNLYFNDLLSEVEGGWVMFMDDDDCFMDNGCLQIIADNAINSRALFWKVYITSKQIVPRSPISKTHPPVWCDVSTLGFLVPESFTGSLVWDGYSRCDYRVATQLYNLAPSIKYIDKILTRTQMGPNSGRNTDRK